MKAGRAPVAAVALIALLASPLLGSAWAVASVGPPPPGTAHELFPAPAGLADDAGEPSIGNHPATGATLFQSYLTTYKVGFSTGPGPTTATWTDVSPPAQVLSFDPILFTDRRTGRTITSQLVSALVAPAGCSISSVSDDDGGTWTPAEGCSTPGGADHQTLGGGPAVTRWPVPAYDGVVYYCSQSGIFASCGVSRDGGLTYGPEVPIYTLLPVAGGPRPALDGCEGLHGHVKVAPDGTAYVPNFGCTLGGGVERQSVVVSEDDGLTWTIRPIPDAAADNARSDPSVALDAAGTAYFAFEDDRGRLKVAASSDRGRTWSPSQDLGLPYDLTYGVMPAVVAADRGRAAVAFLGTPDRSFAHDAAGRTVLDAGGRPVEDPDLYETAEYAGVWHLYLSQTLDGGATWTTMDVTPADPVQRGCIYWAHGDCPSGQRNLLDFIDATYDRDGRVLIGFADGCVGACVAGGPNSRSQHGTIARTRCGPGLVAAGDAAIASGCALDGGPGPVVAEAPDGVLLPVAAAGGAAIILVWSRRRRAPRRAGPP